MTKPVYLYQHLPKCGGRSFIKACSQWFTKFPEKVGSYPTDEMVAEFARNRRNLDELPPDALVHGHLVRNGIRPFERYGDYISSGKCQVLTVVRDPLQRYISAYFHRQKVGRAWPEPLEKWLQVGRNRIAAALGVDAGNWRERLDQYMLVGTTESLQLTVDVFGAHAGKPRVEIEHINTSPRSGDEISETAREKFRRDNPLDYEIYHYAVERLRRDAERLNLAGS